MKLPSPRLSVLFLAALCAFAALPLRAAENPFVGRWALTIPGGRAGWLGVEQKGDRLAASLLWGGGSVLPASEVSLSDGTLKVRMPSGKATREVTATRAGDELN